MRNIVLIAHDIRSTHNVGSLLRTAECLGANHIFLTGYTPYPQISNDTRLPYIAEKLTKQIHKTALGTENIIPWTHHDDVEEIFDKLKNSGYTLVGLEQTTNSIKLTHFVPPDKLAILIGREVEGIDPEFIKYCDKIVEIPQFGKKESLNVIQATAIMLYHCITLR